MKNLVFINDMDIFTYYGATLSRGAYEELLTPPPAKSYVTNESRLHHGVEVDVFNPRVQDREVVIGVVVRGGTHTEYITRFASLVEELQRGQVKLRCVTLKKTYNLIYKSCEKYGNYGRCAGKLRIKFHEPNPKNNL